MFGDWSGPSASSLVTVWYTGSLFTHVTFVPTSTVIESGTYLIPVMFTVAVDVVPGGVGAAPRPPSQYPAPRATAPKRMPAAKKANAPPPPRDRFDRSRRPSGNSMLIAFGSRARRSSELIGKPPDLPDRGRYFKSLGATKPRHTRSAVRTPTTIVATAPTVRMVLVRPRSHFVTCRAIALFETTARTMTSGRTNAMLYRYRYPRPSTYEVLAARRPRTA